MQQQNADPNTGQTQNDALAKALWPKSIKAAKQFLVSGPQCWGPLQWKTLHLWTYWFPAQNPPAATRAAFVAHVKALAFLLPCPRCQRHWAEYVGNGDAVYAATASRDAVMQWAIDAHNAVNARLHKPVLSNEQALRAIESGFSTSNSNTPSDAKPAVGITVWGPLQWKTLHQLTRGYPRTDPSPDHKAALVNYVQALVHLLPCESCRSHWAPLADGVTAAVPSRYTAMKWAIDAHNAVNARLHKPQLSLAKAVKVIRDTCPGDGAAPTTKQMQQLRKMLVLAKPESNGTDDGGSRDRDGNSGCGGRGVTETWAQRNSKPFVYSFVSLAVAAFVAVVVVYGVRAAQARKRQR